MTPDYSKLPAHIGEAIQRYIEYGHRPGSFTCALLSNDLLGAVSHAHPGIHNFELLKEMVVWVQYEVPSECRGSMEKIDSWIKQGGQKGKEEVEAK